MRDLGGLLLALAVLLLSPAAGCRKDAPEERDLRSTPSAEGSATPATTPTAVIDIEGPLDVGISPRPISPVRLMLLIDRSVAASFSIESLKQSLSILLDRLPTDLPLGIRVFPGDAGESSTLLAPVATGERMALKLKVLELAPGGTGSFSRAMLDASGDFIGEAKENRIVLIAPPTKETAADRDPCATARTLRRMAERITVDVVEILPSYLGQVLPGFTQGALACIATEGGGRLLQVEDMGQIDAGVWAMVEEARPNLIVSASLSEGIPLAGDSRAEGGSWGATLYPSDSVSPIRYSHKLPASWAVPPGDYSLRVWYRELSGTIGNIRIPAGSMVTADVNLHAAGLSVSAVDAQGREIEGDFRGDDCSTRWELVTDDGELAGRGCVFPGAASVRAGSCTIRLLSDRYAVGEARIDLAEASVTSVTIVEGILLPEVPEEPPLP